MTSGRWASRSSSSASWMFGPRMPSWESRCPFPKLFQYARPVDASYRPEVNAVITKIGTAHP